MSESNGSLSGKVIIVTGGTQGVGGGIARRAVELGAKGLVICARNEELGNKVAAELSELGTETLYVRADLERVEDCRNVIQACDKQFGQVDGLVNAAAITDRGSIEDTSVELWDRMIAINTRAPFFLMQDTVKIMKREGKGGSIINIQSMSAHGGQPFLTPYSVSKGALSILTKNVAYALLHDHIRVNGINMGWTFTPAENKMQISEGKPENWIEQADKEQPFGRLLRPHDIAGLATYLLSDAAEMMTGAIIDFDQQMVIGAHD